MIPNLEVRLAELAALNQTTTYGQLARDLNLTGPATIARVTTALESLMDQDARENHPFRAALVNARFTELPAPGFFTKAAELNRYNGTDPVTYIAQERLSLHAFALAKISHGGPGV